MEQLKFDILMSYFNFCKQKSDALPIEVAPISGNKHICQMHVHLRYSYRADDTRYCYDPYFFDRQTYAKSVNSDQTAPREAVLYKAV